MRPTPGTASSTHESLPSWLLIGPRRQDTAINDSPRTIPDSSDSSVEARPRHHCQTLKTTGKPRPTHPGHGLVYLSRGSRLDASVSNQEAGASTRFEGAASGGGALAAGWAALRCSRARTVLTGQQPPRGHSGVADGGVQVDEPCQRDHDPHLHARLTSPAGAATLASGGPFTELLHPPLRLCC